MHHKNPFGSVLEKTIKFKADENSAQTNGEITYYKTSENKEIIIEDRNAGHEFPQNSIPKMVEFLKRNHR